MGFRSGTKTRKVGADLAWVLCADAAATPSLAYRDLSKVLLGFRCCRDVWSDSDHLCALTRTKIRYKSNARALTARPFPRARLFASSLFFFADAALITCRASGALCGRIKSYSPELIVIPCYRSAERAGGVRGHKADGGEQALTSPFVFRRKKLGRRNPGQRQALGASGGGRAVCARGRVAAAASGVASFSTIPERRFGVAFETAFRFRKTALKGNRIKSSPFIFE